MSNEQQADKANENTDQSVFEARAQAVLRDSTTHLDGRTQSRLTQARYAALEAAKPRAFNLFGWKLLAPISATAVAVLAVVLIPHQTQHTNQPALIADDMPDRIEILAAEDSLEFYRDVDFYAWLDSELDDADVDSSQIDDRNVDHPQSDA